MNSLTFMMTMLGLEGAYVTEKEHEARVDTDRNEIE
jgi:hypothetical protein